MNIYVVNLNTITDDIIGKIMKDNIPPNSILLFEDVDQSGFLKKTKKKKFIIFEFY